MSTESDSVSNAEEAPPSKHGGPEGSEARKEPRTKTAVVAFVCHAMRREASVLARSERKARDVSADQVHKMRIATRRARSVLRTFRDVLPADLRDVSADLKWLADELGAVRDLDVYSEQYLKHRARLPEENVEGLRRYEEHLRAEQSAFRESLAGALESERYRGLVGRLAAFGSGSLESGSKSIRNVGQAYVASARTRVLKRGRRIDERSRPAQLHELRKSVKRFRYLLESFEPHCGERLGHARKAAMRMQDVLGAYQDACTAHTRIKGYLDSLRTQPVSGEEWFSLGGLSELQRRRAMKARRRFGKTWRDFDDAVSRL